MNTKTKLALQFTFIVAGILLFFSLLVFYISYTSQLIKFRQNLLDNAKNSATLLINVAEVDSSLLKKIQQSTISREKEELAITDSAFHIKYSNNVHTLSDSTLLANSASGNLRFFSVGNKDGIFFKHMFGSRTYYIYSLAYDKSRAENLHELKRILFWSTLFSIFLSVLSSYLFSGRAIKPISHIIRNVKEINSLKLSNRLDEGNKKDEIAQLAITFNEMLTKLEIAFKDQEDFVSNASHELRTPLTIMIGESDYFLSRERNKEDYINHISGLVNDLKKLNTLLTSLLELAQINKDPGLVFTDIRIDEIVFNAIQEIRPKYDGRKIVPKIQYPENGTELLVSGNPGMLEIAFKNLIENACKFSNDDISVEFIISDSHINIVIADKGVGIPPGEVDSIYKPFKRASNVKFIGGYGIGLSLVSKIMELHHAKLNVVSKVDKGTRIEIVFERH